MSIELLPQEAGHYKRIAVRRQGLLAFALNPGSTDRDFLLQRPTVHPLNTPAGYTVTEHGAHNRVHHKGVWIGHSKVDGANCFHDGANCGRIVPLARELSSTAETATLAFDLRWQDAAGAPLVDERRVYTWHAALPGAGAGLAAHRLDIDCTLIAAHGPVEFAKENHAFCGVRVADALDEDDGGLVQNSRGETGEAGAMGKTADWVDTSGRIGDHACGVTLMVHPDSPPQPFFVRSYGTVLADLFLHEGLRLAAGERLRQRFAVLAHDGSAEEYDVAAAYARFAAN